MADRFFGDCGNGHQVRAFHLPEYWATSRLRNGPGRSTNSISPIRSLWRIDLLPSHVANSIIPDLSQTFSEEFLEGHWPWWTRRSPSSRNEGWGYPPIDSWISFRNCADARPKICHQNILGISAFGGKAQETSRRRLPC
ncbi:MAG: hypothetical protein ACTHOP_16930 [Mesorhizobium sp.]